MLDLFAVVLYLVVAAGQLKFQKLDLPEVLVSMVVAALLLG
jgi:hypothetical protein